jgi:lipopolysaccharide export LptBFGC system permease protein LptF
MDMNLCADCGGSGMNAATFALAAGGVIICFALGAALALLAGTLSRGAVPIALVIGLVLIIGVASLNMRPALVFPFAFFLGEGLTLHRLHRDA